MIERLRPAPGTYGYAGAIVAAQMMAQVGGFALPALLPTYMARWTLTATEAGWLVGVFFAAYVAMVPILLSLGWHLHDRPTDHRRSLGRNLAVSCCLLARC